MRYEMRFLLCIERRLDRNRFYFIFRSLLLLLKNLYLLILLKTNFNNYISRIAHTIIN